MIAEDMDRAIAASIQAVRFPSSHVQALLRGVLDLMAKDDAMVECSQRVVEKLRNNRAERIHFHAVVKQGVVLSSLREAMDPVVQSSVDSYLMRLERDQDRDAVMLRRCLMAGPGEPYHLPGLRPVTRERRPPG